MRKRKLKIINFNYLSKQKYNKIREYRNQTYIRDVSLNSNPITREEHTKYLKLLKEGTDYFAYLITSDNKDYGVITLKKIDEKTYLIGDYLVKEDYKYEGGGVVNRYCIIYICNQLNIKFLNVEQKITNTRGNRAGTISQVKESIYENGYLKESVEVLGFNDKEVSNTKARILFDKLYQINSCIL